MSSSYGKSSLQGKRSSLFVTFLSLVLLSSLNGCSGKDQARKGSQNGKERKFIQTESTPNKLVLWTPTSRDISKSSTPANEPFLFILSTAINTSYTVKQDDCLDRIIRTQFLVSGIQQPRAYTAYKLEIQARNHKTLQVIHPNDVLILPSGPHYAALESAIDTRDAYLLRMTVLLNSSLSQEDLPKGQAKRMRAVSKPKRVPRANTSDLPAVVTLSRDLEFKIFQRLGHFTRAYPSPEETFFITKWRRKLAVEELINRRVLPPVALRPGIDREMVSLHLPRNVEVPNGLRPSSGPETLPRFENPDADPADACGADCKKCSELLGTTSTKGPLNTKLLLVDTGVSSDALSPLSLYYGPLKSPPDQQKNSAPLQEVPATPRDVPIAGTDKSLLDFSDPSPNHHGTFIYREIVNYGLLPPETVELARVAVKVDFPGDYVISVRHIVAATNKFVGESLLPANKNFGVWVANLSFGGEVNDADQSQLGLEQSSRILYVVAAGNVEGSERRIDANYVYPKFNGALSNLLVVGALNSKGHLATYSKVSNSNVDLFAQGSCICGGSGKLNDDQPLYGTSQATPIAATAAAILADKHSSWNAQQVKWRLIATTDLPEELFRNGVGGSLNLQAALDYRSSLVRFPPHRTLGEKVSSLISSNQTIPINGVEKTNSGWASLLDGQTQVLRLHRVKSCVKGYSCFRRILFEGNADTVQVEDSDQLPYYDKDGKKLSDLQVEDLVDASFTFDQ